MNKPIIGISTSVLVDEGGGFPGYERIYVNKDYVSSVISAGAVPLMIPMDATEENLRQTLELVDGMIFSGGHDIAPIRYGEEPHQKLQEICPERDEFDFLLYRLAKEHSLPILGICRGFQLMNVSEGGKLYKVEFGSRLYDILGKEEIRVNSFHHQAVKSVSENVVISGRALDGVVEAIELKDYPFGVGVQFHPEMLQEKEEDMKKIFAALVSAAREYQGKK